MLSNVGEWGGSEKENWICAMTRHHPDSNIYILLIRNLPIDSGVRRWSHPLMIPLRCLWTKSNNRMCGQFECDVAWFCFCFNFVRSHARCGCCSIVCLREWGGVRLKLDVQDNGGRKEGWKNFGRRWARGWAVFKTDNFHGRHMCTVSIQEKRR